jgi:hypothetical protein
MAATAYKITSRTRQYKLGFATIRDFSLSEPEPVSMTELRRNPNISLYSLDVEGQRAVLVETPPGLTLSDQPFYWMSQYEQAVTVITLPFSDFLRLTSAMPVQEGRVSFIYSVGRAGSTLASQIFARVDTVESISEPDALTNLVAARHNHPEQEPIHRALLVASVRFLCKSTIATKWVIKGRSQMIEIGDWLYDLYPQAKTIFLYRNAETWLASAKRAFINGKNQKNEEQAAIARAVRAYLKPVTHLVANYPEHQHLTLVELLVLTWLSAMDTCMKLYEMGIKPLPIRFSSWRLRPEATAMAMLEYCNCYPKDFLPVLDALSGDSQVNTVLSQENVRNRDYGLLPDDVEKLKYHLQQHRKIRSGDFNIPGTLGHDLGKHPVTEDISAPARPKPKSHHENSTVK